MIWGGFRGAGRPDGTRAGSAEPRRPSGRSRSVAAAQLPPPLPPFRAGRTGGGRLPAPGPSRPRPGACREGPAGPPSGGVGSPPERRGRRCQGYRADSGRGSRRGRGLRTGAQRAGRGREALPGRHGNGAAISNLPAVPVARRQGARVLQDSGNLPRPGTLQCVPSVVRARRPEAQLSGGARGPPAHRASSLALLSRELVACAPPAARAAPATLPYFFVLSPPVWPSLQSFALENDSI